MGFLFALALILFPPLAGALVRWGGLPPGFGVFPPTQPEPQPPFGWGHFIVFALIALVVVLFLVFPQWFGFKKNPPRPAPFPRKPLPWWFYPGTLVFAAFFFIMAWPVPIFPTLAHFAFVPLWWGFIVALDGLVYARSGGNSLLAKRPALVIGSAVFSIAGWSLYEVMNWFVLENWYYPFADIFPHWFTVIWFLLSYTTVWPALFEWYTLLETSPAFMARYSQGPRISLGAGFGWFALACGAVIGFFVGLSPYEFFWGVWLGPLLVFQGLLLIQKVWSPADDLARGDWTALILSALASLFNGFLWENWNWLSQAFHPSVAENPNYWVYHLPYIDVIHIYAEMPLLGFIGYLPFGVLCWVFWIAFIQLFKNKPEFRLRSVESAPTGQGERP